MIYVYELINMMGTIEYVGETNNPKLRFINHKCKNGLFHKRQDLIMNVLDEKYNSKKEAFEKQVKLQKEYGLITDLDKCSLGGISAAKNYKNKEFVKKLGEKWGKLSSDKVYTCPKCNNIGKGVNFLQYHFDNCSKLYQINKETNEIVNIFDNSIVAQKITGIHNSSISKCVNGKAISAGGFYWKIIKNKD